MICMQEPTIIKLESKSLIGQSAGMSLQNDGTASLFKAFMPRVKEVDNKLDGSIFEVIIYDANLSFENFGIDTTFTKWVAVEVEETSKVYEGLNSYMLEGGLYAKFDHIGDVNKFMETMQYIHSVWLPNSIYYLDNREHFQVLGAKYLGPTNPLSEEEIWIPVKEKKS